MLKKYDPLPNEDKTVRNVSWSKLLKDEDLNLLGGFFPQAFELRPDDTSPTGLEESLSVNWLGYFEHFEEPLRDCIWAMRKARRINKKSAFGIAQVSAIKQICLAREFIVRVIYEPEDDNLSHAGIRRLPPNDLGLMEALAKEAFTEMVLNSAIPEEPTA